MFETLKEADEETVTEENIIPLTRYHNTSIQSDNVDYIGEMKNSLMLESEVPIEKFVDDDNKMYEKVDIVDEWKYKKSVSEC